MKNLTPFAVIISLSLATSVSYAQTRAFVPSDFLVGQSIPEATPGAAQETTQTTPTEASNATQPATVPPNKVTKVTQHSRLKVGPDLGLYIPTKNLVRDRFGSDWVSIGLGFGDLSGAPVSGQYSFNLSLLSNKRNGNSAFLLPIGVQYRKGLSKNLSTTPYVGAEADFVLSDIRSVTDNVNWGVRGSYGGAVFGGVNFGDSGRLELQYREFSDIAHYDFSGTNLVAGLRF